MDQTLPNVRPDTLLRTLSRSCLLLRRAAPGEIRRLAVLTAVSSAGPVAALYLGKVVIDRTVAAAGARAASLPNALSAMASDRAILAAVAGFVVLTILLDSVETIEAFEWGSLSDRVQGHARSLLYEKVASFEDVALFEDPERLNVLQTAEQAIPRLQGLTMTLGNLLNGLFAFLPVFVLSFSIAWWVPLVIFATAVPSILAQARYEKRALDMEFSQAPRYRRMDLQGRVLTGPEYATELRLFGLQELFLSRWRALFRSAHEDVRAVRRRGALVVVGLSLVSGFGAGIPYAYVVAEALRGAFTPGDLALYAGLVFQVRRSLFVLVANSADLQERVLGSAAIFRLLDLRPTLRGVMRDRGDDGAAREWAGAPRDHGPRRADSSGAALGGLLVERVHFSYPGSAVEALSGVDLSIGPGETVVLVGENGAGKTTLAKLLCRLYDPDGGAITWDGKDLKDFDLDALRARIAVLNQDHARFPATAEENVAFGLPAGDTDRIAVHEAAEKAGIADTLDALPGGYDTPLSKQMEGGVDLSGGQWQKVALARAILRSSESELLILDEPTAALDARAEHKVLTTLRRMTAGKMALVVSHRLALARQADRIAVMDRGRVVESGTHRELMDLGGMYREMFNRQAESYIE